MPTPTQIPSPFLRVETQQLTGRLFADFGTVIENPAPGRIPSHEKHALPGAILVNQGTAAKYVDVSKITNFYGDAPSRVEAKAVMNMFVCSPRDLDDGKADAAGLEGFFPVKILERHPFTSQTFIPLGLSKKEMNETRYLVIVAPSLPPSPRDNSFPVPVGVGPGCGMPDLQRIRAFVADGSQSVTYGAGTWHAPMVVVGTKAVDYVVVQYANGVDIEDCQEVVLQADDDREGISVRVQKANPRGLWRL